MKFSKEYADALSEMIATANAEYVKAQAEIDLIIKQRQELQVWYTSEVERLKLETEELERSSKAKDGKFLQAQQEVQADKMRAEGLLTGLKGLVKSSNTEQ